MSLHWRKEVIWTIRELEVREKRRYVELARNNSILSDISGYIYVYLFHTCLLCCVVLWAFPHPYTMDIIDLISINLTVYKYITFVNHCVAKPLIILYLSNGYISYIYLWRICKYIINHHCHFFIIFDRARLVRTYGTVIYKTTCSNDDVSIIFDKRNVRSVGSILETLILTLDRDFRKLEIKSAAKTIPNDNSFSFFFCERSTFDLFFSYH